MAQKRPSHNQAASAGVRGEGAFGSVASSAIGITPKQIVDILRRHVFLIISLTVLGAGLGTGAFFLLSRYAPKFTSFTYIEVLSPGRTDPTSFGTLPANKDIGYQFRVSKAALIKQEGMLRELIQKDKIRQTNWFRSFKEADIAKIIKNLKKKLSVSPERNSDFIRIAMTCGNAEEAALIVNEMVRLFLDSQRLTAQAGVGDKLKLLTSQRDTLTDELRRTTDFLGDIRETSGMTQLEGQAGDFRHTITQRLARLEIEKVLIEADIEQLAATLATIEQRQSSDDTVQRTTEEDYIIRTLQQRLSIYESELARQQTKLGDKHRVIRETKEAMSKTAEEINKRNVFKSQQIRASNVANAQDQLVILKARQIKLEEEKNKTEIEQKDLDNTRARYEQLLTRRDEIETQLFSTREQIDKYNMSREDVESSKVRSMGMALPPLLRSFPNIIIFAPGGTFLGFIAGVGLAFLIELLNKMVRTPSDVVKHLGVPLLGMISHKKYSKDIKGLNMWHVVRQAPHSIMSECYRQIRTQLNLSASSEKQKVMLITSSTAAEGRTTVAINLAATFAAEDKRVLLIDANFRRPTSLTIFPRATENEDFEEQMDSGLSNYLSGQCQENDIIRPSGAVGLDVIDSGQLPLNPAELLGSSQMEELLQYCRQNYDNIVIDGPPMLVSDAKSLAALADGTILVCNTDITKIGAAQRIVRELYGINITVFGAVLIGVRMLKGGYFREMFESYQDYQKAPPLVKV